MKITAKPTTEKVSDDLHVLIVQTEDDVPVLRRIRADLLLAAFGAGGDGNGVGIRSIEQTVESLEDGGVNEVTITMTNGVKAKFHVRNGSKGSGGSGGFQMQIGGDEPEEGPMLWFDTRRFEQTADENVVILNLGGEGDVDDAAVIVELASIEYPVENAELSTDTDGTPIIEITE